MKWKKILVAIDFSESAGRALESARALAAETGGTIVLLHVVQPPYAVYPQEMLDVAALSEAWMREARRALMPLAARARRGGRRVKVEVRFGAPWRRILDVAETLAVDAIVIGASGHSRFERLVLGSTAEKVVRSSPVPVLVTHGRALRRIRRVLAPVDLGEGSSWALRLAGLLGGREASIEALLVVPRRLGTMPIVPYYPEAPPLPPMEESEAALEQFLGRHSLERARGKVVAADDIASGILDHERARKVDLIVIATHGRRGLDRALLGSVAEKVIRHAEAPVLVVPEGRGPKAAASMRKVEARRGTRPKKASPKERVRPSGRHQRGPWTGHAHTGRGGPEGRRGGTPSRKSGTTAD